MIKTIDKLLTRAKETFEKVVNKDESTEKIALYTKNTVKDALNGVKFLGHLIPEEKAIEYQKFIDQSKGKVTKKMIKRWIRNGKNGEVFLQADIDALDLSGLEKLKSIPLIKGLKKLNCFMTGISTIPPMEDLEEFNCAQSAIVEIPHLPKLKKLDCFATKIKYLAKFDMLEVLNCSFTEIAKLPALKNLKLIDCKKTKLTRLENLDSIEHIDCSSSNINFIENFSTLKVLKCSVNRDLYSIPDFQNLEQLFCGLSALVSLPNSPKLKVIKCASTNITELFDYERLEDINIMKTQVSKLPPLKNLKKLWLEDNPINTIKDIRTLIALENNDCEISGDEKLKNKVDILNALEKEDANIFKLDILKNYISKTHIEKAVLILELALDLFKEYVFKYTERFDDLSQYPLDIKEKAANDFENRFERIKNIVDQMISTDLKDALIEEIEKKEELVELISFL